MTLPTARITICVEVLAPGEFDWKLYLIEGKKDLIAVLGRNPKNTHWVPNPEMVRIHRLGGTNLFKLAEDYFELPTAALAAKAIGRTLEWRFVDKQNKSVKTAA